jgi:RNA polymerase sigma-70 factor (ECF subfamily)
VPEHFADPISAQTRQLIEAEIPFLKRAVRAWQRTAFDADDLVQATLLRALANADLWHPESNLRAWLVTIMRNEFLTDLARQKHRSVAAAAFADIAADGHSTDAETRLVLRDVERALRCLPATQRSIVLLAGIEGKSYGEIADIMQLSADAVRCHLARARARLRAAINRPQDTSPVRNANLRGTDGPDGDASQTSRHRVLTFA